MNPNTQCLKESISLTNQELEKYLCDCEDRFDADIGLMGIEFRGPGYHSCVPSGTWVHPLVHNFEYASLLLRAGGEMERRRAASILDKLLAVQDQDPVSRTFGIWPWLIEEPLSAMKPPDRNWADFCGARIAEILLDHGDALEEALTRRLGNALLNAALCIFRRHVAPDYTNIAVMGAGVCALAGEYLDQPWLLNYGRRRLELSVEHARYHGGFNEYNSPTYTTVVIQECERILRFARDERTRSSAETLRELAWQIIADHFHPATRQWAGPHARTYHDRVNETLAAFLTRRIGTEIAPAESRDGTLRTGAMNLTVAPLPCPENLKRKFVEPIVEPEERRHVFIRRTPKELAVRGTTWLAPEACLGSVNRETFFTQRRPLLAYWKTEDEPAVVFKLRLLKDGRDFASALVRNAQSGASVLSAVNFVTDMGDWHPTLDRPASGEFQVKDLRLRYEISGKGVWGRANGNGIFCLGAGPLQAAVHPGAGCFAGWAISWAMGGSEGNRWVDAILYSGPGMNLCPALLTDVRLGAGLEIVPEGSALSADPPVWSNGEPDAQLLAWRQFKLRVPRCSEQYSI